MLDDCLDISECNTDSVIDNSFIVAKMETKKLELNSEKCHKIHIGKCIENLCPRLKTHAEEMTQVDWERYLGDLLSKDGKNMINIKARGRKLLGVISGIMNILREVSLGQFYFEIAMLLREAMFLSVLLFNGETWLNITQAEMQELESLDKTLLRRIVSAPISSPVCSLYAELRCSPVRFLIQAKRIKFLHYILTRKEEDLVSKVFWVQKDNPCQKRLLLYSCQRLGSFWH